ncbi:hypothetical protein MTR67_044008 [Solanum verrucosum]|uniref:Uncharacterized protein n=1 Tax=Solanum verrucosum TaxID=315347 RepID=A0AAF0USI6_SOLVR|nr:hypothetical protein MTR67_044008 [Solanum verrucosum]
MSWLCVVFADMSLEEKKKYSRVSDYIHPIFHVSMLHQYVLDESHVLQYDAVELDDHLTFVEEPVAILGKDLRQLH